MGEEYYRRKIKKLKYEIDKIRKELESLDVIRHQLKFNVKKLKRDIVLIQRPCSYLGEVMRVLNSGGKYMVLVQIGRHERFVVDVDEKVDIAQLTPSTRVALYVDSYKIHRILPQRIHPMVGQMIIDKPPDSTYDMIGGLDEQIKEIEEVIELPFKHPELFESLGIAPPKGVILYGPPGTGKTLVARAVAHHSNCTFLKVSGSVLVHKYSGEGARVVREIFVLARVCAPSIIFFDEVDSIGSVRRKTRSGGGNEVQRTMLELLHQLDGFESSNKIRVIMATNRIDVLDPALLRPGRIDRKIAFPYPNKESRLQILKVHAKKMKLVRGINLDTISEEMNGASGAEIKAVCTEAGMYALRERRAHVTEDDFKMACQKYQ